MGEAAGLAQQQRAAPAGGLNRQGQDAVPSGGVQVGSG